MAWLFDTFSALGPTLFSWNISVPLAQFSGPADMFNVFGPQPQPHPNSAYSVGDAFAWRTERLLSESSE